MFRLDLVFILMSVACMGCYGDSAIVPYEVERESDRVLTSELLRDQFDPIPFRWTVPEEWTEADNDQFSVSAWSAGPKKDPARITVSGLAVASGLEAQFVRWRGQLKLPEMPIAEVMKSVEDVALKGATGKWCQLQNESETILGMIVSHKDKLWIFKFRSANATADKERDRFRSFCKSLEIESAESSGD